MKSSYKWCRPNLEEMINLEFSFLTVWGWEKNICNTPVNLGESCIWAHFIANLSLAKFTTRPSQKPDILIPGYQNLEISNVCSRKGLNQLVLLVGSLASIFVLKYLIFFISPNVLYLHLMVLSTSYMEVLYFTLLFHRSYLGILMPTNVFAFGTIYAYTGVSKSILLNEMSGNDVKWDENVVHMILFKLFLNFV